MTSEIDRDRRRHPVPLLRGELPSTAGASSAEPSAAEPDRPSLAVLERVLTGLHSL